MITSPTKGDVREFLVRFLGEQLELQGRALPADLPDDFDLLLSGLLDSLGLVELMVSLSDYSDCELDFDLLEAEQMTIVGPLCAFVASEAEKA
jgi:acyl carrier protein